MSAPSGWDLAFEEALVQQTGQEPVSETQPAKGGRTHHGSKAMRAHLQQMAAESAGHNAQLEDASEAGELVGIAYARHCRETKRKQKVELQLQIRDSDAQIKKLGPVDILIAVGSPLQRSMGGLTRAMAEKGVELEDQVLAETLEGKTLTSSAQATGALLGKNQKIMQKTLNRAGAAICQAAPWLWSAAATQWLQEGHAPILFCLSLRYDETPTRVRVVDTPVDGNLVVPKSKAGTEWLERMLSSLGVLPKHDSQQATHAKVLQSEIFLGMMFQVKGSDSFVWIKSQVPTPLQAVDRVTGETTRACLWSSISCVPEIERLWGAFPLKVRLACTDRAGANYRCESGLQEEGFMPQFAAAHIPCSVHCLSTAIGVSNSCAENEVSGVLNCGLVLNELGATRRLREILAKIIATELSVKYAMAEAEADARREAVYDMFLPVTGVTLGYKKTNLKRREILNAFLNGSLLEEHCTHYCTMCCDSAEETLAYMTTFVVWALVPYNLPIYSRKSWIGQDLSLDWIGLLEAHHNLFSKAMCVYVGKPQEQVPAEDVVGRPEMDGDGWDAVIEDQMEARAAAIALEASTSPPVGPDVADQGEAGVSGEGANAYQEERKRRRFDLQTWAASEPYPRICVLKDVSRVLLHAMGKFLVHSGQRFERKESAKASLASHAPTRRCLRGKTLRCKLAFWSFSSFFTVMPVLPLTASTSTPR